MSDYSIKKGIKLMFKNNFRIKENESILILTDFPTEREQQNLSKSKINEMLDRNHLARLITEVGKELGHDTLLKLYPATGQSGTEIPFEIAELMEKYDIFIAITTYSMTHTTARLNAIEKAKKRGASCPGILSRMFEPGDVMQADYNQIEKNTINLINELNKALIGNIIAPNGTNITFEINPNSAHPDTGIIINPGDFSNLPAGEAYLAPKLGKTRGKFVVSKGWYKDLDEDMIFIVNNGLVQEIIGGGDIGNKFIDLLFNKNLDKDITLSRRNIAEIGIGTNPNAKDPLNLLEAEKIKGTCHIAIGDNHTFGGTVKSDIHIDFVIPNAKLFLDEREISL
ncbi:MAG: aminopeptidase [Candidatus Helarchaeota archaeon]